MKVPFPDQKARNGSIRAEIAEASQHVRYNTAFASGPFEEEHPVGEFAVLSGAGFFDGSINGERVSRVASGNPYPGRGERLPE